MSSRCMACIADDCINCSRKECSCFSSPDIDSSRHGVLSLSKDDPVKHPAHYTRGKIEVWDFVIDQGLTFCLGNAIKYICRSGYKNKAAEVQDLNKAKAYIDREIKRIQG